MVPSSSFSSSDINAQPSSRLSTAQNLFNDNTGRDTSAAAFTPFNIDFKSTPQSDQKLEFFNPVSIPDDNERTVPKFFNPGQFDTVQNISHCQQSTTDSAILKPSGPPASSIAGNFCMQLKLIDYSCLSSIYLFTCAYILYAVVDTLFLIINQMANRQNANFLFFLFYSLAKVSVIYA